MPPTIVGTPSDFVRSSCLAFVSGPDCSVAISEDGVASLAQSLDENTLLPGRSGSGLPLKFSHARDKVNLLCVMDMLQFGSGYRKELNKALGKGAVSTIKYGMIGMHLCGVKFTTAFLRNVDVNSIAEHFHLPLMTDEPVEGLPGVTMGKPSSLKPLAEAITATLRDAGDRLFTFGMVDFYDLCEKVIKRNPDAPAQAVVRELVEVVPKAFDDRYALEGGAVVAIFKKAQLVAADLHREMADEDPLFSFKDVATLTIFSDNVVPCVLRHLGLLQLPEPLARKVDLGAPLPHGDKDEVSLRAASVVACERVLAAARTRKGFEGITAMELDFYLYTMGKDDQIRAKERHYTKCVFY
jgi:hypothetical protein